MPDWSYHPFFRPLLFRLPPDVARDLTLSSLGLLASLPLGKILIEFLGHMQVPVGIERSHLGLNFPGPVGLGAGLDVHLRGTPALAHFGLGFVELGPVTLEPVRATLLLERRCGEGSIASPDLPVNDGLAVVSRKLARIAPLSIPLGICLAYQPGASAVEAAAERCQLIKQLALHASFFTLDTRDELATGAWSSTEWREHLATIVQALRTLPVLVPLLVCLAADTPVSVVEQLLTPAIELGISGVVVGCGVREAPGRRVIGAPIHQQSVDLVRSIHQDWSKQLVIIGSGGIVTPADALDMLEAGAALVQVHSGLVYSGPGLPKRINEAVAYSTAASQPVFSSFSAHRTSFLHFFKQSWLWMAFLGISMLIGGMLVGLIAMTSVILPYDAAFLGLNQAQIAQINPHILPFMTHDRMTLAGTMFSLGILYFTLAVQGIRKGLYWAWLATVISCAVGFVSFFLFLGFGYFDPLHALVSVILFLFFCLGLRKLPPPARSKVAPNVQNDRRWLLSQWGQLFLLIACVILIGAGLTIATVGVTHVFVPEDLVFLRVTPAELQAANPQLIPLIAHDRAGFGGALVSDGLALLMVTLWGFRRGARWIWWMLAMAGTVGSLATISIHVMVGYTNLWHLAPVFLVAVPYTLGLIFTYPYLTQKDTPFRQMRLQVQSGDDTADQPLSTVSRK